jgi:hypothetical protein
MISMINMIISDVQKSCLWLRRTYVSGSSRWTLSASCASLACGYENQALRVAGENVIATIYRAFPTDNLAFWYMANRRPSLAKFPPDHSQRRIFNAKYHRK